MAITELLLIAVGLSMDAFTIAISRGLLMKRNIELSYSLLLAILFGSFQAFMPFLGYKAGNCFKNYIINIDHWIAFLLLSFIGAKMIFSERSCKDNSKYDINYKELPILALATSVDALAVGVSFSFLHINIISACTIIGAITYFLSLAGVVAGCYLNNRLRFNNELIGGIILIIMAIKILFEHIGII